MWTDIKSIYRSAWTFMIACPLLFLIPVFVEMAQHVAEIHIGMYHSLASARAVADSPLRMTFAVAKIIALMLPGYWFVRYLAAGNDPHAARRIEPVGLALWSILFTLNLTLSLYSLFGPPLGEALGLTGSVGTYFGTAVSGGWSILSVYLSAWIIAWTLGNATIGPLRSVAIMNGYFWRTVVYMVTGVLPLMVVHYALGYGAMGCPNWLIWPMLIVDAFLVGILALTMTAPIWLGARRAAEARGVELAPHIDSLSMQRV